MWSAQRKVRPINGSDGFNFSLYSPFFPSLLNSAVTHQSFKKKKNQVVGRMQGGVWDLVSITSEGRKTGRQTEINAKQRGIVTNVCTVVLI